mgnify:CR=1 FL=1
MTASKNQIQSLDRAISSLENKRKNEFGDLKDQFFKTSVHFKPINLIGSGLNLLNVSK